MHDVNGIGLRTLSMTAYAYMPSLTALLRRHTYAVNMRMRSNASVTTLRMYCGLSERCVATHNDMV